MLQKKTRIKYAPRLAGGDFRVSFSGAFADAIKEGLRAIAKAEGRSMRWVVEECVIDRLGLRPPRYLNMIRPTPLPKRPGAKFRRRS